MKIELTKREMLIVVFLLSLLVLGATINFIRGGGNWTQHPIPLLQK